LQKSRLHLEKNRICFNDASVSDHFGRQLTTSTPAHHRQSQMDSSEELPPLTFAVPAFRQSLKKQETPSEVRLKISPIHFSAIGFIAAALAKQIMFARGRINQSFSELESFVEACHVALSAFIFSFDFLSLKYKPS
jgi:hypothetical protein